jgi:penicillin-binding protein-related factor A (putative recombinase)
LTYGALQSWLNPTRKGLPNVDNFRALAQVFGLTMDELYNYLNSDNDNDEPIPDEAFDIPRAIATIIQAPKKVKVQLLKVLQDDLLKENES